VSFSTSLNFVFEPHAFENAARYQNAETKFFVRMIGYVIAKLCEVGYTYPWEPSVSHAPPPKIARR